MSDVNPSAAGDNANGMALTDSIYNRLLKERIIWLGSEVRDDNANAICAQMLLLAAEDPEADIYLYINSPGGSVTAGMAIYDTMQYVPVWPPPWVSSCSLLAPRASVTSPHMPAC